MFTKVLLCLAFFAYVHAQDYYAGPPQPYQFGYQTNLDDGGSSSQEESGDANNFKTGSYSITTPEGTVRTVRYVADDQGFRATVETNEPGTANSAPAGVEYISSAQ